MLGEDRRTCLSCRDAYLIIGSNWGEPHPLVGGAAQAQSAGRRHHRRLRSLYLAVLGDSPYADVFTGMLTDAPDIGASAMSGGVPRETRA